MKVFKKKAGSSVMIGEGYPVPNVNGADTGSLQGLATMYAADKIPFVIQENIFALKSCRVSTGDANAHKRMQRKLDGGPASAPMVKRPGA